MLHLSVYLKSPVCQPLFIDGSAIDNSNFDAILLNKCLTAGSCACTPLVQEIYVKAATRDELFLFSSSGQTQHESHRERMRGWGRRRKREVKTIEGKLKKKSFLILSLS